MIQGLLSLVWNAVTPSGVDDVFCCLCHIQGPFLPFMSLSFSHCSEPKDSQKHGPSLICSPVPSIFLAKAFTYACLELASGRMTKRPGGVLKAMSPAPLLQPMNLYETCSKQMVRIPPLPD